MAAGAASRNGQWSVCTGVVLTTALVALLHLFGCPHGPIAAGILSADSVPVALAAPECVVEGAHPGSQDDGHCPSDDEPSVLTQRFTTTPPSTADTGAARVTAPGASPQVGVVLPGVPHSGIGEDGRSRAALGIWRN
ncbi:MULTISPECIES: hypothetical protein [Streptomyces]|uniref:hypothetical protein n=1 Tax=Streptomyces lycopersici TaxID=2974589 RepID=UPI0021D0DF99|nr:hypothetical protein [Streptomyces sp. NEAU-383]